MHQIGIGYAILWRGEMIKERRQGHPVGLFQGYNCVDAFL
jgi:hypothetical protein